MSFKIPCLLTILVLLCSCERLKYEIVLYQDDLLLKESSFASMTFSSEYKILKKYHSQKNQLVAHSVKYESDGHQVDGFIIKSSKSVKRKGVILYIRGGFRSFKRSDLRSWLWLEPLIQQGYHLVSTQYRFNPLAIDQSEYLDQFGGDEVKDIEQILKIYEKENDKIQNLITLSWGSRGGITTYKYLEKFPKEKIRSVIIEGASDFAKLEKERGGEFFSFLDIKERSNRSLENIKVPKGKFLLLHSKSNAKTSVEHALNAKKLLENKGSNVDLILKEELAKVSNQDLISEISTWIDKK